MEMDAEAMTWERTRDRDDEPRNYGYTDNNILRTTEQDV